MTLGRTYTASIREKRTTHYATEKVTFSHELLSLQEGLLALLMRLPSFRNYFAKCLLER